MYDVTTGEVGKPLNVTLQTVDNSTSPPTVAPMDLTDASAVELAYAFGSIFEPIGPLKTKPMSVIEPTQGLVQYIFEGSDLDAPGGFPFVGKIAYVVKVTFNDGTILESGDVGILTVKQGVG